jgi:hypothetical protein
MFLIMYHVAFSPHALHILMLAIFCIYDRPRRDENESSMILLGMRWPKTTVVPVCLRSSRLLPGVGVYFDLVGTSEKLPTWTTWDVWSGTLRGSSMESMWHVDRVFSYRVYIDLNRHDSQIWVSLVCGSHHVDILINLLE